MKKINSSTVLFTILLFASACNKNQKAVRRLDGIWNLTNVTINYENGLTESSQPNFVLEVEFDKCKLKKDEYCNYSENSTIDGNLVSVSKQFRIVDDGKTMETRENSTDQPFQSEILELTRNVFRIKELSSVGNSSTEYSFEKK